MLQEAPSEEDLTLGRRLLAGSTPEAVAAALVRLYRSQLPEPEDVFDDRAAAPPPPAGRPPRERRGPVEHAAASPSSGGAIWFRMPVGRTDKADPKWLIPLICRRGHVTKKDIGAIRILPRETHFEIAPEAERRFREALRKGSPDDVPIEPSDGPDARGAPPRRPPHRPPHGGRGPRRGNGPKRGDRRSS